MSQIIPIKDLRKDLAQIANLVEKKGHSFIVMRRSRPAFKIMPITKNIDIKDEDIVSYDKKNASGLFFPKGIDPQVFIDKINEIDG